MILYYTLGYILVMFLFIVTMEVYNPETEYHEMFFLAALWPVSLSVGAAMLFTLAACKVGEWIKSW